MSILERLTPIFHDVFDDETIVLSREMTAEDVPGWDSLAQIRLIVSVERTFGIKFTVAEVTDLKNVGDFADLISSKLYGRAAVA